MAGEARPLVIPGPAALARPARRVRPLPGTALWTGAVIVGAWALVAAFGPLLAPHSPLDLDVMNRLQPPSAGHPFGTDEAGRDNFSRVVYGARITIPVAVGVIVVASAIGVGVGGVSGYAGGRTDEVLMRIVDVVLAFPSIVLAMAITAALGPGLPHAMLAIVLVAWAEFSRLMRGQVLAAKANDYVLAARALGAPAWRVLLRHVLPNAFPPVVVKGTLDIGNAIILTAALSFIGLGAIPPAPEWGAMIAAGQTKFEYWWVATFPGLAILSVVLGFNFLGDGLQDLLNPRLRDA
ncbi:MAG: ABC transporter permease [Bacillati bacterium ANGP1]|uniref:ABC transporter permease n=2 Tax=Candidatus Segetimicrobium genomatis TaxID=2569760 RepID=A0A537KFN9_9BACT|nr:MAG: ABC transporter permease [Terrabacteria group bacterium ANGP1]